MVVREIALGAGVGAKVWRAAIMLSEELAANPGWCEGKRCLEIGAGVGLCGLLASRLGASSVALTDFEHPLLDSLVVAVDRNRELLESVNNATLTSTTTTVRRLDWIEDSERGESKTDADAENVKKKKPNGNEERLGPTSRGWIEMDDEATFDFIFGSDLLYEDVHARTLPGVVKRRMSVAGREVPRGRGGEKPIDAGRFSFEHAERGPRRGRDAPEGQRYERGGLVRGRVLRPGGDARRRIE